MAQYKVKDPDLSKLDEIARLAHNVRYWTNEFRGANGKPGKMGIENHIQMGKAEKELDNWLKENTERIPEINNEENVD